MSSVLWERLYQMSVTPGATTNTTASLLSYRLFNSAPIPLQITNLVGVHHLDLLNLLPHPPHLQPLINAP